MRRWFIGTTHFGGVGSSPTSVILSFFVSFILYFEQLHIVSFTIIDAIDHKHTSSMAELNESYKFGVDCDVVLLRYLLNTVHYDHRSGLTV